MTVERSSAETNPLVPVDPNLNTQKVPIEKKGKIAGHKISKIAGHKISNESKEKFLKEVDELAFIGLRDFDKKVLLKMKKDIGVLKERVFLELPPDRGNSPDRGNFFTKLFKKLFGSKPINASTANVMSSLTANVMSSLNDQEKRIDQKIAQFDKQDEAAVKEKTKQLGQLEDQYAEMLTKYTGLESDQTELDNEVTKLNTSLAEEITLTGAAQQKIDEEIAQLKSTNQELEQQNETLKTSSAGIKGSIKVNQDKIGDHDFQIVAVREGIKIILRKMKKDPGLPEDLALVKARSAFVDLSKKIIELEDKIKLLEQEISENDKKIEQNVMKIGDNQAQITEKGKEKEELTEKLELSKKNTQTQKDTLVGQMTAKANEQSILTPEKIALEGEINKLRNSLPPPSKP